MLSSWSEDRMIPALRWCVHLGIVKVGLRQRGDVLDRWGVYSGRCIPSLLTFSTNYISESADRLKSTPGTPERLVCFCSHDFTAGTVPVLLTLILPLSYLGIVKFEAFGCGVSHYNEAPWLCLWYWKPPEITLKCILFLREVSKHAFISYFILILLKDVYQFPKYHFTAALSTTEIIWALLYWTKQQTWVNTSATGIYSFLSNVHYSSDPLREIGSKPITHTGKRGTSLWNNGS